MSKRLPFLLLIYIPLFACQHDIWQHLQIATEPVCRRQEHRRVARSVLDLCYGVCVCVCNCMRMYCSRDPSGLTGGCSKNWWMPKNDRRGRGVWGPGLAGPSGRHACALRHRKSIERGSFKTKENKSKGKCAARKDDRAKFTQPSGLGLLICI